MNQYTSMTLAMALQTGYRLLTAAGCERWEAAILLSSVLEVSRSYLFTHSEQMLSDRQSQTFFTLIDRRLAGEPFAYVIGHREFWSVELEVTPDTLIPRPETELLVELALTKLPSEEIAVADLGVGSGAIAISLAIERPNWKIIGTDISSSALTVANRNVMRHHLVNVQLLESNWCQQLPAKCIDAIVCNPPYIAEQDAHLVELRYEPLIALVSGKDGLDAIRQIIQQAVAILKPGGLLLIEHGYDQADQVQRLLGRHGYVEVESYSDLNGILRVTGGKNTW